MPHKKTSLVCCKCGEPIYTDEGFLPGKHPRHMESCEVILSPKQCKQYKPPADIQKEFKILSVEKHQKRRAGFSFEER